MPRTRSLAWSELKIGIVAVLGLAIAAALIFAVGGQTGLPWQRYELKTRFADVRGLKPGALVRVAGIEVGSVTSMEFAGAAVELTLELHRSARPRVTTESRASIGSLSLLGEPVVDISASDRGTPLPDGAFVEPVPGAGLGTDVAAAAGTALSEAARLLQDVRAGKGTVGRLFTDDALFGEIQELVDAAADVATNLRRGRGTLGALATDPAVYRSLKESLDNLDGITRRVRAGEGTLGRLVADEALARSLTSAAERVDTVAGKLATGDGTAGRLVNDPELYNRLNSMAASLDRLSARLDEGQGTAGRLLHDSELYENMNAAVREFRDLVAEIRKDPRKYLTVRVSIF